MADNNTINKVKELLNGHCYGPLKEAAEKWLAEVDEQFDIKDAAAATWDKLSEAAETVSDASIKFNDKMGEVSAKLGNAYDVAAKSEFVKQLKEGICTLEEVIEHFGAKEVIEKFGADMANKIKSHAEELKGAGKKYCDCPACTKAREILEDLGEELDDFYK